MTIKEFPKDITLGDKYGPAMEITEQDEADVYFERCVQHMMSRGKSREEAEKIELGNLGYYAGYYSHETRSRVELLFKCQHPVFGSIKEDGPPTTEQAFQAGLKLGEEHET